MRGTSTPERPRRSYHRRSSSSVGGSTTWRPIATLAPRWRRAHSLDRCPGSGFDVDALADELEHAAIDLDALARTARDAFAQELSTLREDLARGMFLRAEALRQWQAFVGADEVTRGCSHPASGGSAARSPRSCGARLAPPWPRSARDTLADLRSLAWGTPQKQPGARRPAGRTARSRHRSSTAMRRCGGSASTSTPGWRPGSSAGSTASARMSGRPARPSGGWRGAALGVNATGIAVMLATFSHTGGLTGAEVGVAAATGFLNQKLLEALFGEAWPPR